MKSNRVYAKDGWVYVDDKQTERWFATVYDAGPSSIRIWPPVLKDVKRLESRWWRMLCRYKKFMDEVWRPAHNAVVEFETAHAKVNHSHSGRRNWWQYKRCGTHSVRFDWVEKPEMPINLEVGQHYYDMGRKEMQYSTYLWKFDVALTRAIYKEILSKEIPYRSGIMWRITINDREFLYLSEYYNNGSLYWKKINWPNNNDVTRVTVLK